MLPGKQAFVADLEKLHGKRLRRFLASRLRNGSADVADLSQEVYLRLLRINHHETIRSPEAYLFTTAFHVLHQHVMRRAAMPETIEITALIDQMEGSGESDPARLAETEQDLVALRDAMSALPPKAQAVLLLHRRDGYTLDEIAKELGFSRANAAKYLAKALAHCRLNLRPRSTGAPP